MVAEKALTEEEKMRRVPGIIYVDGPAGRRARVVDGLDVWEIIKEYKIDNWDRQRLARSFDWLAPEILDTALAFYAAFPEEIDGRLAEEDEITPETLHILYPLIPRPRPSASPPHMEPCPPDARGPNE